jgi:hypothetical protein
MSTDVSEVRAASIIRADEDPELHTVSRENLKSHILSFDGIYVHTHTSVPKPTHTHIWTCFVTVCTVLHLKYRHLTSYIIIIAAWVSNLSRSFVYRDFFAETSFWNWTVNAI